MTCPAIGRESPKPEKQRKVDNDTSSLSVASVDSAKSAMPKSPKMLKDSPRGIHGCDSKTTLHEHKSTDKIATEVTGGKNGHPGHAGSRHPSTSPTAVSMGAEHCLRATAHVPLTSTPSLHESQQAMLSQLMSQAGVSNQLLQGTELDRYLRASASLYGATFPHPALTAACYPTLPGLLPSMSYMPYLSGSWNTTGTGIPSLAAYSPMQLSRSSLGTTESDTSDTSNTNINLHAQSDTCNWGNCGKKFINAELLAIHVKNEHLGQPIPSHTQQSLGAMPTPTLQSSVPRFAPYSIPGYPRDLLSSRFVYS